MMIFSYSMKNQLKNLIPFFFLIIFIIIGLWIYKDYGIPWDEQPQINIGYVNHLYIRQGDPALFSFPDRYYGPIIELPLLVISTIPLMPRHLAIFFIFVSGLIMFYILSRRLFHNTWMGLLASCVLAISPRIFADAFYNSKDIPFLVAFIAAILTLVFLSDSLIKKPNWQEICVRLIAHAGASAILISTRIPGIVIIPLTLFLVFIDLVKSQIFWKSKLLTGFGYLILTAGLTILFWPILWHNPWGEFVNAFIRMANYPWSGKVFYMGNFFLGSNLPWHYLLVWIGITTPIIILVGIIPGILEFSGSILNGLSWIKKRKNNPVVKSYDSDRYVWMVVMGWLVIPVSAIYIFHSTLYNGWRQMFFIYPAILLISLSGLRALYRWLMHFNLFSNYIRIAAFIFLLIGLAEPIWFIVRYHPHENVYFNVFSGDSSTLYQRFELDYWGLSYKQSVDFILASDHNQNININFANSAGDNYINLGLTNNMKSRLRIVKDPVDADYFVSNFPYHSEDYPNGNEYYSIIIRGTKIMVVYKR